MQPVQQVDPLVERKYRENLYASVSIFYCRQIICIIVGYMMTSQVYAILVATVEKMVLTLPEQEL